MEKKAIKTWKKKWKVSNASQRELLGCTVVIRFSARGAYLLLVRKGRAVIKDRVLISFSRNRRICETELVVYLKTMKKTSLLFLDLSWRERKAEEIIRLKELCAHMDCERTCLCWETETRATVFCSEAINELLKEGKPRLISIDMYMYPNSAIRIGRLVE